VNASCHMSEDHTCLTNMIVLLRACDALLLQLGLVLGLILAVILGVGLRFGARLFTDDVNVLHLISIGIPVLLMSETSNSTSILLNCLILNNPGTTFFFFCFFVSVCCSYSTHQCLGLCF
jgi:Na+-driven multidrug efflux pump